jgi:hypothetical protein
MPGIVEQMVKPAEKIDRISINQVQGLHRAGSEAMEGERSSPVSQIVDSILDMSVALPAMNKLGEIIGEGVDKGAGKSEK